MSITPVPFTEALETGLKDFHKSGNTGVKGTLFRPKGG
jgi:hypothetical protein